MYKKIAFIVSITFFIGADSDPLPTGLQESPEPEIYAPEMSNTDELLDLVKNVEIQAPDIKPPSRFMVIIRTFGIAVISRYYALKGWIVKKWSGETPS